MPLIKSPKKSAVSKNIKTEMEAGKKHDQAIAIALELQRQAKHKMAKGHKDMDEDEMAHGGSVAERIRAKKKMAMGGEVDLDHNSDEDLNMEDQLSFEAARKHTYYDDSQIDEQPIDSNEHSDDLADADEHDMVSAIRRKMKSKLV